MFVRHLISLCLASVPSGYRITFLAPSARTQAGPLSAIMRESAVLLSSSFRTLGLPISRRVTIFFSPVCGDPLSISVVIKFLPPLRKTLLLGYCLPHSFFSNLLKSKSKSPFCSSLGVGEPRFVSFFPQSHSWVFSSCTSSQPG